MNGQKAPKGPKSNPWFRYYIETLHDPKVQNLPGDVFKTWVNLLCLASEGNGGLPPIKDIAFILRLSAKVVQSRISRLVADELLDLITTGEGEILTPHNWAKRQFVSDHSADRVRKFRAEKRASFSIVGNGDETANETAMKRPMKRVASESGSETVSVSEIVSNQGVESLKLDRVGEGWK